MIHPTAIIANDIGLGDDASVGAFVLLGVDGEGEPLSIGHRALIRSHSVIYRGAKAGDDFHAGHGVLVRQETLIGHRVSVGSHSVVEHHVVLEDGVRIHSRVFVPEYSALKTGCWVGPGAILTNACYPNTAGAKRSLEGVCIESDAVVGAGAVILPGVTIGRNALVGAGAVVVHDVEPDAVVVGNPARRIR